MKHLPILSGVVALLIFGVLTTEAQIVWTNILGGDWSVAANWDLNRLPNSSDAVQITTPGTYTVTLHTNATMASLTVGGAVSGTQTLREGTNKNLTVTTATIGSRGVLIMNGGSLSGAFTVANGGEFDTLTPKAQIGGTGSLNISGGGTVNLAESLYVYGPITNAGLITVDASIYLNNNGTTDLGGIVNQTGGQIVLPGPASIVNNSGGHTYVTNQGAIIKGASAQGCTVAASTIFNMGLISVQKGVLSLVCPTLQLQPSSVLNVSINGPNDFTVISIGGNALLGGTFSLNLNGGYVPSVGGYFRVLYYSSASGNFTSFSYLPPVAIWRPVYGPLEMDLIVQPFFALSGSNLAININGAPGHQAILLTSPIADAPLTAWTPVATNTFDGTGYLSFASSIDSSQPHRFFVFRLP